MPRYAVAARDPTIDLYAQDDFYGLEVVECDSEDEARSASKWFNGLEGLNVYVYKVDGETELGWHDELVESIDSSGVGLV